MRIETSWGTLSAIDEGSGPVVVLLHPLAQAGEVWRPLIDELSPHFRVLAPDARGHGQSTWDGEPFTIEDLAADAATLIEEVGGPAAVLGMSMGGCTAIALAVRRPELVSRLVLADTTADYGPDKQSAWAARAETASNTPREKQLGFQHDRWFSPSFLESDPAEVDRVSQVFLATDSRAHAAASLAMGAYDDSGRLAEVQAPTLILVGDEDYATPPAMAQALHAGIASSTLTVLPETRHLSLLQNRTTWPSIIEHIQGSSQTASA
ncbi:alpha/beta fold hydrolase [Nocardioides sp. LHG3406-4]|uniref:alpha/beta fold hydrolase n=1 Tax=Nocardioides sp. LHG3406-4 TaxID=2804575 RepID=UPI003CEF4B44